MKRSTASGTIVLAAALFALPASGLAQTAPPQQPPATQPPAQPPAAQPPATQPPAAAQPEPAQRPSAEEHLAKANAALNEIQMTAVTGPARTSLTTLRKHMAALDRAAASQAGSKAGANNWATDVAAIDRILTELTTPVTPAGDPAVPTGTTGTVGAPTSKPQSAIAIDDATRAKLMEVRTHITAYAAAKSGTPAPAAPPDAPATAAPPATTPPATEPPATAQPPATPPPATPPAAAQPPATQPPATQPPATPPSEPAAAAPGAVDKDAAKRHLTEARDTLSQLTQLPEAAQLTGDARTQVSQLIANFNELITTQASWRATFDKVQANLTALIGAERTDEANVPPPATGTPGAVGTSGMATLDQKIRDKLVEFRTKLAAFERAVSGGPPK